MPDRFRSDQTEIFTFQPFRKSLKPIFARNDYLFDQARVLSISLRMKSSLFGQEHYSGKSVFVKRFIQHLSEMVTPTPDEVIYCCSEYQPSFDSLEERGVRFIEGLPEVDEWPADRKHRGYLTAGR